MALIDLFAEWAGADRDGLRQNRWVFAPCVQGGEIAGVGALRGYEIHFAVAPAWRKRLISRRTLREYLGPLFRQRGFLTTRACRASHEQIAFIQRLGFVETARDFHVPVNHYMLSAVPFSREN